VALRRADTEHRDKPIAFNINFTRGTAADKIYRPTVSDGAVVSRACACVVCCRVERVAVGGRVRLLNHSVRRHSSPQHPHHATGPVVTHLLTYLVAATQHNSQLGFDLLSSLLSIMPKLRSTCDCRLVYETSYEGRKAFLRYDSLAKF